MSMECQNEVEIVMIEFPTVLSSALYRTLARASRTGFRAAPAANLTSASAVSIWSFIAPVLWRAALFASVSMGVIAGSIMEIR